MRGRAEGRGARKEGGNGGRAGTGCVTGCLLKPWRSTRRKEDTLRTSSARQQRGGEGALLPLPRRTTATEPEPAIPLSAFAQFGPEIQMKVAKFDRNGDELLNANEIVEVLRELDGPPTAQARGIKKVAFFDSTEKNVTQMTRGLLAGAPPGCGGAVKSNREATTDGKVPADSRDGLSFRMPSGVARDDGEWSKDACVARDEGWEEEEYDDRLAGPASPSSLRTDDSWDQAPGAPAPVDRKSITDLSETLMRTVEAPHRSAPAPASAAQSRTPSGPMSGFHDTMISTGRVCRQASSLGNSPRDGIRGPILPYSEVRLAKTDTF